MTYVKKWAKAAIIRALKTAAETAISLITVGAAISEVNWLHVASCTAVAAILSILWSLKGLPEVGAGGDVGILRYADKVLSEDSEEDTEVVLGGDKDAGN